jgi:tetratricopeptide (TPR) repeat protein
MPYPPPTVIARLVGDDRLAWKGMRNAAGFVLAAGLVFALLACLPPEAAAQDDFGVSATASPVEVEVGQKATVDIKVTNLANKTFQPVILVVYIYPSSMSIGEVAPLSPDTVIATLGPNRSANVSVTFSPKKAESHLLTVKIYSPDTQSANFKDSHDVSPLFLAKPRENGGNGGLPMGLIIGAVAAVAAVVTVVAAVMARRRKAPAPVTVKPPVAAAPEPVEEKVEGKFPKDYYKFRREKFSKLKPVGLTRSGNTILGNIKKAEEQDSALDEPAAVNTCPKCGTAMERNWRTCHNCGSKDTIAQARASLARMEELGIKGGNLEDMLQSAESSHEARNYDEAETYAHDVLDRARNAIKRHEEAHRPSDEPPSYAAEESATREGAPAVASPAAVEAEPAKGYAGQEEASPGYRDLSGTKEYSALKKAEKKDANACWKCAQGLRPEWKKCPYCNSPQEGICPSCGRGVKLRWKNCPHCRTDLTVEKPALACPVCAAELPAEGECQSCRALALMDTAARLVKEVKAKGADVVEAESLLGRGEMAVKIKNYEKAVTHFERAEELARKARKEYRTKRLKERLEAADRLLKDAVPTGADMAAARKTLSEAQAAQAEDRIDEGLALAEKFNNQAAEAMEKAPAQKSATPIPVMTKRPEVVGDVKVKPRCPHCQEQIDEGLDKCPFCLSALGGRCPRCGAKVQTGWKACPACEAPLK